LTKSSRKLIPHYDFPLRQIVRRETQNGTPVVVMACGHAVLGKPESRYSRFYPCLHCHQLVERIRAGQESASPRPPSRGDGAEKPPPGPSRKRSTRSR